jgi:Carboxypeptidase regulatory-like domain
LFQITVAKRTSARCRADEPHLYTSSVVAVGIACVLLTSPGSRFSGTQPKGWLRRSVKGPYESPIPGAAIKVRGSGTVYTAMADKRGDYEMELPPGIYAISLQAQGYFRFRRAPFRVRPGETTVINIRPTVHIRNVGHGGATRAEYESFLPIGLQGERLSLLIEFQARLQKDQNTVEYQGARLSYDGLMIAADKILFDKPQFRFTASKQVLVDDGNELKYVRQVVLHFEDGEPMLEVRPGAVHSVKGRGSIDNLAVYFDFSVDINGSGNLVYTDEENGIELVSSGMFSFDVLDDELGIVRFGGAGIVNGEAEYPVTFSVTIRDNESGAKTFAMDLVREYNRSGTLSSGNIEIVR